MFNDIADEIQAAAQTMDNVGNALLPLGPEGPTEVGAGLKDASVAVEGLAKAVRVSESAGKMVLGKFPEYIEMAKQIGAKCFSMPMKIWKNMSASEQWAANQRSIDRGIARGYEFILSDHFDSAGAGTGFQRELEYMTSKGYLPSEDGYSLISPGG